MKSERANGFLAGLLTMTLVFGIGSPAMAATMRQLNALYDGVTIILDGNKITPTDINGNKVEPFSVDGTIYLPVRSIADALGLGVEWDDKTQTITLSSGLNDVNKANNDHPQVGSAGGIEATKGGMVYYLGTAVLGLKVINHTNEDIVRFDMKIKCYDAYGEQIDGFYSGLYSNTTLKPEVETEIKWNLIGSDGTYKVVFGIYKYSTSNGTIVEIPEDEINWKSVVRQS